MVLLDEHRVVTTPLVVFVDELDRCRPDFAIKLIEVVKHLFDVPGVCFVVSTNMKQLSESVRAVYGGGFDAAHYLQRFFDLTYHLPPPDHYRYAMSLFAAWPQTLRKLSRDGYVYSHSSSADVQAHLFAATAREFALDLRTQKKVFDTALTASSAIPQGAAAHSLFLFFLSALYVQRRDGWDNFWSLPNDSQSFVRWYSATVHEVEKSTRLGDINSEIECEPPRVQYQQVVYEYWRLAVLTGEQLLAAINSTERRSEAQTLRGQMLSAVANSFSRDGRASIYDYKLHIELAGQTL